LILLFLFCLFLIVQTFIREFKFNISQVGKDAVSRFDRKFEKIRADLPNHGIVGLYSDELAKFVHLAYDKKLSLKFKEYHDEGSIDAKATQFNKKAYMESLTAYNTFGELYRLTQFAVLPLEVIPDLVISEDNSDLTEDYINPDILLPVDQLIGLFLKSKRYSPLDKIRDYELFKDYGNGTVLYKMDGEK